MASIATDLRTRLSIVQILSTAVVDTVADPLDDLLLDGLMAAMVAAPTIADN